MRTLPLAVTISGSPAPYSMSHRLLDHVGVQLIAARHRVKSFRLRDIPAAAFGDPDSLLPAHPGLAPLLNELRHATLVVIGTPVYHGGVTGLLKSFLDLLPDGALRGKRVLPVATVQAPQDILALDYSLRPVLAALGASSVEGTVLAVEGQARWGESGLRLDTSLKARFAQAVSSFVHPEFSVVRHGELRNARQLEQGAVA